MITYTGQCHCGDVQVIFETALEEPQIMPRTCDCTFCRRVRPVYASDPAGQITLRHKAGALRAYRFGHETADFISCARCGVFLGAISEMKPSTHGVLNVAGALMEDLMAREVVVMNFDGEGVEARNARRDQRWTPVRLEEMP